MKQIASFRLKSNQKPLLIVDNMPIENTTNPLICDNTTDTLYKAHCLLRMLEDLYANQDKQWLQEDHAYTGMQLILQCANEAIAYELDKKEPSPYRIVEVLEKNR